MHLFLMLPIILVIITLSLEIGLSTYKSSKESRLAFLYARIASSEIPFLANRLNRLIEIGDKKSIREALVETGFLSPEEKIGFSDLKSVEKTLLMEYDKRFDALTYYTPERLKRILSDLETIRDCENLKTIIRCVAKNVPSYKRLQLLGLPGKMGYEALRLISKSNDVKEITRIAECYLPPEMTSRMDFQDRITLEEAEASIDRAAADYIADRCSRAKVEDPNRVIGLLTLRYEVKDIITLARLKYANVLSSKIGPIIIGRLVELSNEGFKALISARNYKAFYDLLLTTSYGKNLPKNQLKPTELERRLESLLVQKIYTPPKTIGEESILRYMIGLEYAFQEIWRAIVFSTQGG